METNPEGTAQTYIFLVDNQDIALNIVMSGYQALCLVQEDDGYYFSVDSFIEEMRSIQFTGSHIMIGTLTASSKLNRPHFLYKGICTEIISVIFLHQAKCLIT